MSLSDGSFCPRAAHSSGGCSKDRSPQHLGYAHQVITRLPEVEKRLLCVNAEWGLAGDKGSLGLFLHLRFSKGKLDPSASPVRP